MYIVCIRVYILDLEIRTQVSIDFQTVNITSEGAIHMKQLCKIIFIVMW